MIQCMSDNIVFGLLIQGLYDKAAREVLHSLMVAILLYTMYTYCVSLSSSPSVLVLSFRFFILKGFSESLVSVKLRCSYLSGFSVYVQWGCVQRLCHNLDSRYVAYAAKLHGGRG